MALKEACASYFDSFHKIYHFRQNDGKTNTLALLKMASYCTLVLPAGVGMAYALSSIHQGYIEMMNSLSLENREWALREKIGRLDLDGHPHCLPSYTEPCCKLACDYAQRGDIELAKRLLKLATYCAKQAPLRSEAYQTYQNVIKATEQKIS